MSIESQLKDATQAKLKELEEQIETLTKRLEAKDASRYVLPSSQAFQHRKDTFLRVFLTDLHGAHAEPTVLPTLFDDLSRLDVKEIILGGDMIDCGGFLAEHHTIGFVAEMDYSYEDDLSATNQFLDKLQQTCPRASITYLQGNHEWRVDRWVVTHCAGKKKDAKFLTKQVCPQYQLHLEKRGILFVHSLDCHDELRVGGTIKRGNWCYTHKASGKSGGITAGAKALSTYSTNVVFGHTHVPTISSKSTVTQSLMAINPGCLCKLQPVWMNTDCNNWRHGYLLQICDSYGDALSIPVTIDNHHSLLRYLWEQS